MFQTKTRQRQLTEKRQTPRAASAGPGRPKISAEKFMKKFEIKTNKMVESQVDAQMRILKVIRSEEVNKKWEGYAPDLKWKRTTISDVMILQELESVREENKTIKKQMVDMKKEQGEILGLVQQMREVIIGDNQEQNTTEKEANNEPDRGNKGEEQGPQKRSANAGRKSGPTKKPKNAGNPHRVVLNTQIQKAQTPTPTLRVNGVRKKRK